MKQITFTIGKSDVYKEVARTTSYDGAKSGDAAVYNRIFTTDEDEEFLDRFWTETKGSLLSTLKRYLVSESETTDSEGAVTFTVTLEVSGMYDDNLTASVQNSLFSYFVSGVISKWYTIASKDEAAGFATEASANLEDIMRKITHKVKPTRPTYD